MVLLTKAVSWSSIVELGTKLCDHCRGQEGKAFTEAFRLGARCPQNSLSFGGREAALNGQFIVASSFAWLKAKQENTVEELDQFIHGISAYAESDVDYLMWQSATSGTRIVCVRKTQRSASRGTTHTWIAEYHEGHKPSQYGHLWSEMTA